MKASPVEDTRATPSPRIHAAFGALTSPKKMPFTTTRPPRLSFPAVFPPPIDSGHEFPGTKIQARPTPANLATSSSITLCAPMPTKHDMLSVSPISSGLYTPRPRTPTDLGLGCQLRVANACANAHGSGSLNLTSEYFERFSLEFAPPPVPLRSAARQGSETGKQLSLLRASSVNTFMTASSYPQLSEDIFAGPYRILGTLGSGSSGKVLLAEDTVTHSNGLHPGVVAIKVIQKNHMRNAEEARELGRELKILQLVTERADGIVARGDGTYCENHGMNFVQMLYRTFQDNSRIYLALEYHPSTLSSMVILDYLRNPPKGREWSAHESLLITTAEIVEGLLFLHSLGIIHHDVKPPNILVSTSRHVVITDFGGSRIRPTISTYPKDGIEHHFGMMEVRGDEPITFTPFFAAPELIRLEDDQVIRYDERSDWWSLGVLVFSLLCDDLPYAGELQGSGESMPGWEDMVTSGELDLSGVKMDSAEKLDLVNFIQNLLVIDPNERLTGLDVQKHRVFDPIRDRWEEIANMRHPPFPEDIVRWGYNRLDNRLTVDRAAGPEEGFSPRLVDKWIKRQGIQVEWERPPFRLRRSTETCCSVNGPSAVAAASKNVLASASGRSLPEPAMERTCTLRFRAASLSSFDRAAWELAAFPAPPPFWRTSPEAFHSFVPFPQTTLESAYLDFLTLGRRASPESRGRSSFWTFSSEAPEDGLESERSPTPDLPGAMSGPLSWLKLSTSRTTLRLDARMRSLVYLSPLITADEPKPPAPSEPIDAPDPAVHSIAKANRLVRMHPRVFLKSLQGAIQNSSDVFSPTTPKTELTSSADDWILLDNPTLDDIFAPVGELPRRPAKLRRKRSIAPSAAKKIFNVAEGTTGAPSSARGGPGADIRKIFSPLKRGFDIIRLKIPYRP